MALKLQKTGKLCYAFTVNGTGYVLTKQFRDIHGPLSHGTGWYLFDAKGVMPGNFCHETLTKATVRAKELTGWEVELTPRQAILLMSLQDETRNSSGTWYAGNGWVWDNDSTTAAILRGLVAKGYATHDELEIGTAGQKKWGRFTITEAGRARKVRPDECKGY